MRPVRLRLIVALCRSFSLDAAAASEHRVFRLRDSFSGAGVSRASDYRGIVRDLRIKPSDWINRRWPIPPRRANRFHRAWRSGQTGRLGFRNGGFTSDILFHPGRAFDIGGGQIVAVNLHAAIAAESHPERSDRRDSRRADSRSPRTFRNSHRRPIYALADAIGSLQPALSLDAQSATTLLLAPMFFGIDRFLSSLRVRPDANLALYDKMTSGARVHDARGFGQADDLAVFGTKVGTLQQLFLFLTRLILSRPRARHRPAARSAPTRPLVT